MTNCGILNTCYKSGEKQQNIRPNQRFLHRWANKWVTVLGPLQSMQAMLFVFPESATMPKVSLELSHTGTLPHFLFFSP